MNFPGGPNSVKLFLPLNQRLRRAAHLRPLFLSVLLAFSAGSTVYPAVKAFLRVATAETDILIDNVTTAGNATVVDGNTLETQSGICRIRLKDGSSVQFARESRGRLRNGAVDLEKGSLQVFGYTANANGLTIRAEKDASGTVSV